MFRIRSFGAADHDGLVRTIDAVCGEGRWMSTTQFEPTESWLHALAEPKCPCHSLLVVEDAGQVVGWCRIFPGEEAATHEPRLGIGLLPSYRERGIGSGLVCRSLAWAKNTRHAQVRLTTHCSNARAMHVFACCGFAYARHVDEDLIEMTCDLQAHLET